MAENNLNILAGIAAGGTSGGGLAWFAPQGTAGPIGSTFTAEVQTVTITGTATALIFGWNGLVAPSQAGNVATTALATALNGAWASKLGGGTIGVAGTAGTSYVVTFPAALGNVPAMTVTSTGATNVVAETTPGTGGTPATVPVPAAYKDAGWCDTSGLAQKVSDTSKDITPFGSLYPVRTILSQSKKTFDITFLESNHTALEIYHRVPIGSTGTADATGYFEVTDGPPQIQFYSAIFDTIDGLNHVRVYCPLLQVTSVGDLNIAMGSEISYPVTFTAFPDSSGNAIYWHYVVNALANA